MEKIDIILIMLNNLPVQLSTNYLLFLIIFLVIINLLINTNAVLYVKNRFSVYNLKINLFLNDCV